MTRTAPGFRLSLRYTLSPTATNATRLKPSMASESANVSTVPASVCLKHILLSEILSVTSVMRKNSRWAMSTHSFSNGDSALATSLGLRRTRQYSEQYTSDRGSNEQDLMRGFQELRRTVKDVEGEYARIHIVPGTLTSTADLQTIPLTALLGPFFAIIRSPLSTGPITSAALTSLHTFFQCGLFTPEALALEPALSDLSSTVSRCKFEASDSSGDEVTLLKIMTVIQDCMCGPVGDALGDIEVCEMLETVLTTCCQMRLSGAFSLGWLYGVKVNNVLTYIILIRNCDAEILRRSAEATMHALVKTAFMRLYALDAEEEEHKLAESGGEQDGPEAKMTVVTDSQTNIAAEASEETVVETELPTAPEVPPEPRIEDTAEEGGEITRQQCKWRAIETYCMNVIADVWSHPDGLPSILELLRVLINILDPTDQAHTDSTRLTALRILNVAFEVAGLRISAFPSLSALVLDHGCKYFFQLARSDNPTVLQTTLRTISTMFETMRCDLKLQQELFLAFIIDRLAPPVSQAAAKSAALKAGAGASPRPGTPQLGVLEPDPEKAPSTPRLLVAPAKGDTRELLLETLSLVSRHPNFMVDLYVNYDCDMNCENMFERLIEFAAKVWFSFFPLTTLASHGTLTRVFYTLGHISSTIQQRPRASTTESPISVSRPITGIHQSHDDSR